MKVLFIGGTGVISSACSELAVAQGVDLVVLNRGQAARPLPVGVTALHGDLRDWSGVAEMLAGRTFDVVVNWIAFTPEQVQADIDLFAGRVGQYIFISTASAYHKPPLSLPITESTPLYNPIWPYSQAKIACEELLVRAYRERHFPITIVRPSHTYDRTKLPMHGRYTVIDRMRRGKPVIVHGDGTSLWTLTHHRDFAKGFVPLLGNAQAIGEAYHITSDEVLTWNQIFTILADAAGAPEPQLVHIPSELLAAYDREWGLGLLGDKAHSAVFDNSKIKRLAPGFAATIPFSQGAREIMAWFDADSARREIEPESNALYDRIISAYQSIFP